MRSTFLALFAKGLCMGAADVVPGVSGGTMALILGIYGRFIDAIKSFDLIWLRAVLVLDVSTAMRRPRFEFVLPVLAGIVSAVLFFTRVVPIPELLTLHPALVYGLFFGLICGSLFTLTTDLGGVGARDIPALFAGVLLGLLVVTAVPTQTPEAWWFIVLAGSLAVSAMMLPGISGSFVLLMLGKYAYVLDAVGHFRFHVLLPFILGLLSGLVLFSRALAWVLHRYERGTMVAMTGILAASLWVVWPFQNRGYELVRGKSRLVSSQPVLPDWNTATGHSIALAVLGAVVVVTLHHVARRVSSARGIQPKR